MLALLLWFSIVEKSVNLNHEDFLYFRLSTAFIFNFSLQITIFIDHCVINKFSLQVVREQIHDLGLKSVQPVRNDKRTSFAYIIYDSFAYPVDGRES